MHTVSWPFDNDFLSLNIWLHWVAKDKSSFQSLGSYNIQDLTKSLQIVNRWLKRGMTDLLWVNQWWSFFEYLILCIESITASVFRITAALYYISSINNDLLWLNNASPRFETLCCFIKVVWKLVYMLVMVLFFILEKFKDLFYLALTYIRMPNTAWAFSENFFMEDRYGV